MRSIAIILLLGVAAEESAKLRHRASKDQTFVDLDKTTCGKRSWMRNPFWRRPRQMYPPYPSVAGQTLYPQYPTVTTPAMGAMGGMGGGLGMMDPMFGMMMLGPAMFAGSSLMGGLYPTGGMGMYSMGGMGGMGGTPPMSSMSGMNPPAAVNPTGTMSPALGMGAMGATGGMNPMAAGLSPMGAGINPMAAGMNPMAAGMNPMSAGMNPIAAGMNPLAAGVSPMATAMRPTYGNMIGLNGTVAMSMPAMMNAMNRAYGMGSTMGAYGLNRTASLGKMGGITGTPGFYQPGMNALYGMNRMTNVRSNQTRQMLERVRNFEMGSALNATPMAVSPGTAATNKLSQMLNHMQPRVGHAGITSPLQASAGGTIPAQQGAQSQLGGMYGASGVPAGVGMVTAASAGGTVSPQAMPGMYGSPTQAAAQMAAIYGLSGLAPTATVSPQAAAQMTPMYGRSSLAPTATVAPVGMSPPQPAVPAQWSGMYGMSGVTPTAGMAAAAPFGGPSLTQQMSAPQFAGMTGLGGISLTQQAVFARPALFSHTYEAMRSITGADVLGLCMGGCIIFAFLRFRCAPASSQEQLWIV